MKAFITGISGQDGSYLAEFLLSKGYEVHGLMRTAELNPFQKLHLTNLKNVNFHTCPMTNHETLSRILKEIKPDEFYHLAGQSFVRSEFLDESSIVEANINSTLFFLSCLRSFFPNCRFFFAGSSEMFGLAESFPQTEMSPLNPRSIYGISKVASFQLVRYFREHFKLFGCTGIAYNHESPRRAAHFVTRKISLGVARIHLGSSQAIELGNIDAMRDWGYAPDYIEAMWRMLQSERPVDYVLATGKLHTVREVLEIAFSTVGLNYEKYIVQRSNLVQPPEVVPLIGDASRIKRDLEWEAKKDFAEMIQEMVRHDIQCLEEGTFFKRRWSQSATEVDLPNN